MLKIAICDDDARDLKFIHALLQEYLEQRPELAAKASLFSSGAALLSSEETAGSFDLYLLDILMPGMNGIEAGKALRSRGGGGLVIYLTSSPDFAAESYWVGAFSYLLKPVGQEQFFQVMDRAAAALSRRKAEAVFVSTPSSVRLIALDEILYAELKNRAVRYHLIGGETVDSRILRGSFAAAVEPLLADRRFLLCGPSFAVNLHRVKEVRKTGAVFYTGASLPLSRSSRAEFKRRWMEYWLEGSGTE